MRITISKSSQNVPSKAQPSSQKQQQLPQKHQKHLWMINQIKMHKNILREATIENHFCCDQGFFSKCLPASSSTKIEFLTQLQIASPYQRLSSNYQKVELYQEKNAKLKVLSNMRKVQRPPAFLKNLQTLRKIKQKPFYIKNVVPPVKSNQNEQTKKNTEVFISREESFVSTFTKPDSKVRQLGIQSCSFLPIAVTPQKINLTVSRKSKLLALQSAQVVEKKEITGSGSRKETQIVTVDKKESISKKNSHYFTVKQHQGSESEFKIVDPFDEFQSINTEYLKNRIAFSSVQSQRQQQQNQIVQSIFYIKEVDVNSFTKKTEKGQFRAQFFKEVNINSQIFSPSEENNSQESIVLEKNFQQMFLFSVPSFSKIPTSEEHLNMNSYCSSDMIPIRQVPQFSSIRKKHSNPKIVKRE